MQKKEEFCVVQAPYTTEGVLRKCRGSGGKVHNSPSHYDTRSWNRIGSVLLVSRTNRDTRLSRRLHSVMHIYTISVKSCAGR
jgi:hypothetical protein